MSIAGLGCQKCPGWVNIAVETLKGHLIIPGLSWLSCLSHFIQPTCWIMLVFWNFCFTFHSFWFILCHWRHWSFFISVCPPGKRGSGLVCGETPSCCAQRDLVGHGHRHKLRTNWNSCGCSIGLSPFGSWKAVVDCWWLMLIVDGFDVLHLKSQRRSWALKSLKSHVLPRKGQEAAHASPLKANENRHSWLRPWPGHSCFIFRQFGAVR